MKDMEANLRVMRESLLQSLWDDLVARGVLSPSPTDDFNESEARWVAAFRGWEANERCLEFGI
jgi:hypothetical protein